MKEAYTKAGLVQPTGLPYEARDMTPAEEVEEHADRPGQTLATRSHEVIRAWAGVRGAVHATVPSKAA